MKPSRSILLTIAAISRVYSIPYITLVGWCAVLAAGTPLTPTITLLALIIPTTLTIGLSALNDYAHARADVRAGRGRGYSPLLLLLFGLGGSFTTLVLASIGGAGVVAGLGGSIVLGVVYALIKRWPLLGNIFRGTTTVSIVLGIAALAGITPLGIMIAVGAGILDASGNVWGDVRDADADRQSGTHTIAVVSSLAARGAAIVLHAIALAVLAPLSILLWWTLVGSALALIVPARRSHQVFLMVKYITFLWIAGSLTQTIGEWFVFGIITLCSIGVWPIYTTIHIRE